MESMLVNTLRTSGTYWGVDGNLLGTKREHGGNQGKLRKIPLQTTPQPPQLKRKKCKAPWVSAWAFSLAAWNFSSQKSSPPFLAWPIPLTSPTFFCGIWSAHCKTMSKFWRLPKIEDSIKWWSPFPFGPDLLVRRGRLWAKHMGLKQGEIESIHGEHIGNLLRRKEKWKKSSSSPAPSNPKLKRK